MIFSVSNAPIERVQFLLRHEKQQSAPLGSGLPWTLKWLVTSRLTLMYIFACLFWISPHVWPNSGFWCCVFLTDNSIAFKGRGWGEREKRAHLISKSTKTRKHTLNHFQCCVWVHLLARFHTKLSCCSPAERMGFPGLHYY